MDKEYLIQESPLKAIFMFALPMIIGNLFQQFYTMVDSIVVGRYVSEDALAAIGASYSLTNVFICIAIGGGVGASVITSRYFGSREYSKMKRSMYTAFLSFFAISILLAVIGYTTGEAIARVLNTPEDIMDMTKEYLDIYFLGLPFLFMYNIFATMFNAIGRSKIPLYLLIFSSVFNIGLDIYMVCVLHLGIAGVAWATFIAQGISVVASFFIFMKELKQFPTKDQQVFSNSDFIQMSKVALPSIFQQSAVSIGMLLVQSVVNGFGTQVLAGFSAAMRAESICIVPMAAMGNAMSSFTAQNMGAKKFDRVKKGYQTANGLVLLFAVIICIVLELYHDAIIQAFLGEKGTIIALETGSSYVKFMGWFFILIGLKMCVDGLLRGAADMKLFMVANLANFTFRVCFAVIMAPKYGIAMVWYAVPIGWLINFIISFGRYRTGKWMHIGEEEGISA
ncbi:MAG: MATE family efflux transporter [Epulopiscium sp.]|jgi:putative MATE family efflux protein|nr:MATE family efflux transporter [Candidatus Epulonipiscium sp.]